MKCLGAFLISGLQPLFKKKNILDVQKIIKAFVTTPNKIIEAVFNNTLNTVDKDGDGIINFTEFQELMLKCMD